MSASSNVTGTPPYLPTQSIACCSTDTQGSDYAVPTLGQFLFHLFAATVDMAEMYPSVNIEMLGAVRYNFQSTIMHLVGSLRTFTYTEAIEKMIVDADDYTRMYVIHLMLENFEKKGMYPDWEVMLAMFLSEAEPSSGVISDNTIQTFVDFFTMPSEDRLCLMYLNAQPECDSSDPTFTARVELRRLKAQLQVFSMTQTHIAERYQLQIKRFEAQIADIALKLSLLKVDARNKEYAIMTQIKELETRIQARRQLDDR